MSEKETSVPDETNTERGDLPQQQSKILAASQDTDDTASWAERIAVWCHDFDSLPFRVHCADFMGRALWCYLQTRLYDTYRPEMDQLFRAARDGWDPIDWRRDIADPPLPDGVTLVKPHDR